MIIVNAVKITNLRVPSTYIFSENVVNSTNKPLVLDCEYDIKAKENGFVLKWYFNGKMIYQYIPDKKPVAFFEFKNLVDTSFAVSEQFAYKYRALLIKNPTLNLSGEYLCSVQTFQTFDRQAANLHMVVPEKLLYLKYETSSINSKYVNMQCSVFLIHPEPDLVLM